MKKEMMIGIGSSLVTAVIVLVAVFMFSSSPASYGAGAVQRDMAKAEFASSEEAIENTMLAYSAFMTVEVPDVPAAEAQAKAIATGFNGYLSGVSGNYEKQKSLTLTFKVPAENLEEAGEALKQLGELETESLSAYDVKNEYDELSARIESLDAERTRLLDFYGRANETSDLIEISSRLSYVDSQLNYLNQRKAELEDVVNYSTLSVTLKEKMGAFSKLVWVELADLFETFASGLNWSLSAMFWAVGLAIPLAILGLLLVLARRKKLKKRR